MALIPMVRFLLTSVLVLLCTYPLQAQSLEDLKGEAGAFYTFADPSDITIEVKVWGAVSNPGLYEIRQGVHLSTLFSLAGGPRNSVQNASTSRSFSLRLYRSQGEGEPILLLEQYVEDGILLLNEDPTLMHGDLLVLEERVKQKFNWRDGVSILSVVGTLVLVAERIISSGG